MEPLKRMSPLRAFLSLREFNRPFIFLGGNMPGQARYSFVAAEPFATITVHPPDGAVNPAGDRDVFRSLSEAISEYGRFKNGPFPFNGGAAGYFSYDLKGMVDGSVKDAVPAVEDNRGNGAKGIPLSSIGLYDTVFVYDHLKEECFLVSAGIRNGIFKEIKSALTLKKPPLLPKTPSAPVSMAVESNLTKEAYVETVNKALDYIASGDIYQINLSQRLKIPLSTLPVKDPFTLYLALTRKSPARFSSFMDLGRFQIISNSPERLLKIENGFVETEPIKGTRPRGKTPDEDRALIEELKNSPKEKAEHLMIVDLERNDIGKVSLPGTVEVTEFSRIETYPNLHHMVSSVRGRLAPSFDAPAALKAVFPGGSVTGAPKIRAMEIIAELEPDNRGIYTGGIGWMDFSGKTMDVSMAIRTAVCMDSFLSLNVGGGIVADSVPEEEYAETLLKAKDFLKALKNSAINGGVLRR
ncbi:MAG: aminodeoxychorismate synthase component I [Deltaproteobacteria bacterium]|nr:aminodeoxychorismate synthase component I [Deltaproteobacteria bacterium]